MPHVHKSQLNSTCTHTLLHITRYCYLTEKKEIKRKGKRLTLDVTCCRGQPRNIAGHRGKSGCPGKSRRITKARRRLLDAPGGCAAAGSGRAGGNPSGCPKGGAACWSALPPVSREGDGLGCAGVAGLLLRGWGCVGWGPAREGGAMGKVCCCCGAVRAGEEIFGAAGWECGEELG